MSRRLSLNARLAQDGLAPEQIEVVLIEITHSDLDTPIRLSTDNTERLSDDPIMYGTRSSWNGADKSSEPFLWIVASAVLPGDAEDAPASAQIVLDNLDAGIAELLRSFIEPATARIAVVMAATPDEIEGEWHGLQLASADGNAGEISITLTREEIEQEHFPPGRMTRHKFPGLHL
jgi:hypothetical protein